MNADATPRTTVVSNARKLRTRTRADLRMCQRSHKGAAAAGGSWKLLGQPSQTMSDSSGAVRRRGREWTTKGFAHFIEGDHDALLRTAARPRVRLGAGPRCKG